MNNKEDKGESSQSDKQEFLLSQSDIENIKEFLVDFIKKSINNLNRYNETQESIKYQISYISLKIENENSLSFPYHYSIDQEIIKELFLNEIALKENIEFNQELMSYGLFNIKDNLHILNPHITLLGNLLINYFDLTTEVIEPENIEKIFPISFNQEIFDTCWQILLPWLIKSSVTLKIYYPILHCTIVGESPIIVDSKRNLMFKIPTKNERETLAKEFRIRPSGYEGHHRALSRLSWIAYCAGWIEGNIEVSFVDLNGDFPIMDIIHPSFYEEVFLLLGLKNVKIGSLIFNNPLEYRSISIQPSLHGQVVIGSSFGGTQFPSWLENSSLPLFQDQILELTENDIIFFQLYPNYRSKITQNSIKSLVLNRFFRAIRSRLFIDVILDISIGIETLLVDGKGDLSLQFRLNTSWFIGNTYEERIQIEKLCKVIYEIRSCIVYSGGKPDKINYLVKKTGGIQKTRDLAIQLFRLIILRLVVTSKNKLDLIKRDFILEEIKNARLRGGLKISTNPYYERFYKGFFDNLSSISLTNDYNNK